MHVRQKILSCRSKSTVAYIFTNVMSKVVVFMLDIQSTVFTRDLSASDQRVSQFRLKDPRDLPSNCGC